MIEAAKFAAIGKAVFPCGLDKRPLVKWREAATSAPETVARWWSHWPQAMIGLPCGEANDLFVLDLDTDKETGNALGAASLSALGYGHLLDGPQVRTPSGGIHLYFRHWSGGRNSVRQLGEGVDTRSEGGYVIAAGSQGAAGRYEGTIDWEALPKVPLGLRARLTPPPRPSTRPAHSTAEPDEVVELLSYVPADCDYQTWVTTLMALHDRYRGGEDGLAVAEQWSARGSKYRPGEVAAKWRSFKRTGVTFASLPALAKRHGADLAAIARKYRRTALG